MPLNIFEEKCYTCLNNNGNLVSVYSNFQDTSLEISEVLTQCLHVKVNKDNHQEAKICNSCLDKLESCYFFFKQCRGPEKVTGDDTCLSSFSRSEELNTESTNESHQNENVLEKENKKRKCPHCDKCFSSKYYYVHIRKHKDVPIKLREWIRRMPKKSYSRKKRLQNYEDKFDEKPKKQCLYCEKTFASKYFYVHVKSHEIMKTSDYLQKSINKKQTVKAKAVGEKSKKENVFNLCAICGKLFKTTIAYTAHIRGHTGEKPYSCKFCGKRFPIRSSLSVHMTTHTNDKRYICYYCGLKFARFSYMKRHIKYHTNDKSFICEICGKGFVEKSDLRNHTRVHTGERPYQCQVCLRRFRMKTALKYHSKVHSDDRPHICNLCGRGFRRADSLKYHVTTHTKNYIRQRRNF